MKYVGEEIGKAVRSTSTWLVGLRLLVVDAGVVQLVDVLQLYSIQLFQLKKLIGRVVRRVWTLAILITSRLFYLLMLTHTRRIPFEIALQIAEQNLRLIFVLLHELNRCMSGSGTYETRRDWQKSSMRHRVRRGRVEHRLKRR